MVDRLHPSDGGTMVDRCAMVSQKARPFQHGLKHVFDKEHQPRLSMLKLTTYDGSHPTA